MVFEGVPTPEDLRDIIKGKEEREEKAKKEESRKEGEAAAASSAASSASSAAASSASSSSPHIVLVLDDLAMTLHMQPDSRRHVSDYFTRCRHDHVSLVFITQQFFDPYTRIVRNNTHYFAFMQSRTMPNQLKLFLRQSHLCDRSVEGDVPPLDLYQYYLIDVRPQCRPELVVRKSPLTTRPDEIDEFILLG